MTSRPWVWTAAFCAAYFVLQFGAYPWDGMIINDAWRWYMPSSSFAWPPGTIEAHRQEPYVFQWIHLASRRAYQEIWLDLIGRVSGTNKTVGMNVVAVSMEALNVFLFSLIAILLGGRKRLFPLTCAALLYPFASASRFWQDMVKLNLAVGFCLASLALFSWIASRKPRGPLAASAGAASLVLFWVSVMTHEFAVFMSPVYLYIGLYFANDGKALLRFTRWIAPGTLLGAALMALSAVAAVRIAGGGAPTANLYAAKYAELAAKTGLPASLISTGVILLNASLCALSALYFNTIGFLGQPAKMVLEHAWALSPARWAGTLSLAALGVLAWRKGSQPARPDNDSSFVLIVGLLWAAFSYLPFFTALGYPRIVGFMADRENILAMWGMGLVWGELALRLQARLGARTFSTVLFAAVLVLLANVGVQRAFYLEFYDKERALAKLIQIDEVARPADGRKAVVLLERKQNIALPKERLMKSLNGGLAEKAAGVGGFLLDRYFTGEYLMNSFHLNGMPFFGCCPGAAGMTFFGYSRIFGVPFTPVYTLDGPFRQEFSKNGYRCGYADTAVWAKEPGRILWNEFPKKEYSPRVMRLEESFFELGGKVDYAVRDADPDAAIH